MYNYLAQIYVSIKLQKLTSISHNLFIFKNIRHNISSQYKMPYDRNAPIPVAKNSRRPVSLKYFNKTTKET